MTRILPSIPQSLILLWMLVLGFTTSCSDTLLDEEGNSAGQNGTSFEWTRSSDLPTRYAFLRNYGVGYSYNAVDGEYCNWNDIRCQIINRDVLERLKEDQGITLFRKNTYNLAESKSKYLYNQRDYVAGIHLESDTEVDLGLYNKTKRTRQDVLEDGKQENFYYSVERTITKGSQALYYSDLLDYVSNGQYEYLLTSSFRNAIQHMQKAVYEENHNAAYLTAMVDSFIDVYGTHVIVNATLGGKIRLDLSHEMWRYNDKVQEKEWTQEEIFSAYSQREENRKEEIYKFIEKTSIYVTAYGGDQTCLADILGETRYDGTRNFSPTNVNTWQATLKLDPNDENNSNVELIDMEVCPIWEFIEAIDPDGMVVKLVKGEITQDISHWQELLGPANFFNTSFPVGFDNPKVNLRQSSGDYITLDWNSLKDDPNLVPAGAQPCINLVSGGRYVAVTCQEEIDGQLYWMAFPIYEGKPNLKEGIAVSGDKAYQAQWKYTENKYHLIPLNKAQAPQTSTFYVNEGAVSLVQQSVLDYTEAHPMLYLEITGGVQPDGSIQTGNYFVPVKKGLDFTIPLAPKEKSPDQLIGWKWNSTDNHADRLSTYTYIYNPSEMDYAE